MNAKYYLQDGTVVSSEQIKAAFSTGRAVLAHNRADNGSRTSLMLNGRHFDTRGQCYSMREEVWTTVPKSLQQALQIAYAR